MRAMRPRQTCSSSVSMDATDRTAVDVAAGQLLATTASLGEQAGLFEHGNVLLHRGEAHLVLCRERGNRVLPGQHPTHDVAPRPVGERMEQGVCPVLVVPAHIANIQPIGCMLSTAVRGDSG